MLSLDGENGGALFKAPRNSITGMIKSKATKVIRKWMFENVEIFDGDFQKQKASVSKHLIDIRCQHFIK